MAKKAKVKEDFIEENPTEKIEQSQIKHDKIEAAATTFTNPDVTLVDFQKHIDDLTALNKAVEGGDHSKLEARDAAVLVLNEDLRGLAAYVTRIAKGSEVIIVLAGFTPTKTEITKSQLPGQGVVSGNPGKSMGDMNLSIDKIEFAIRYTFVVSEDLSNVTIVNNQLIITNSAKPIFIKTTNLTKTLFINLDTRVNFQCACFATSTVGSGKMSEIVIVKSA